MTPKPKFLFAVSWEDNHGQTLNLFTQKSQAETFYKILTEKVEVEKISQGSETDYHAALITRR